MTINCVCHLWKNAYAHVKMRLLLGRCGQVDVLESHAVAFIQAIRSRGYVQMRVGGSLAWQVLKNEEKKHTRNKGREADL